MAVIQQNKAKVRPVMDYRELNQFVSSHSAHGDVCGEKLRAWRRMGENLSIIDLRKAYLQIRVHPSLWQFQVVEFKSKRYCLTRLGFGLTVAPKIMTHVLRKVLSMDKEVAAATDSYVDDIIVNNDLVSNEQVMKLLERYGLEPKEPESLEGGRVLGLRVHQNKEVLRWRRDNVLDPLTDQMSRRRLFSWCGQMVGHFPVASWLRPACSYLKRMTNGLQWDEEVDAWVIKIAKSIENRVAKEDPVGGFWYVSNVEEGRVWCDASSIAIGTCVEIDGSCGGRLLVTEAG
jgi:hypothetical protein